MDEDYQLALLLQKELNNAEPEIIEQTWKGKEDYKKRNGKKTESLVDPQWEFIDPTPDIHVLFMQFNGRFFWGKLHTVEVKWSSRMTSCAGVCVYQGRSGFCSVRLSLPLLKLRPRKDLVETLLHEMIHAFLFVTKNNRDRDGHGPEFHKHMDRINQEAGTRITVYHSFHDEVRLYQQHWWRCNGLCQHRPPFFGMVRRATNRAPGPNDRWFAQHEATCGGKFIKVKEPENIKKKSSDTKKKISGQSSPGKGDIRSFFPGSASSSKPAGGRASSTSGANKSNNPSRFGAPSNSGAIDPSRFGAPADKDMFVNVPQGSLFKQPSMTNVHGFAKGEVSSFKPVANPAVNNVFGFGDLNGQGTKQLAGSSQPRGKGYVLGGSGKPPYRKGGGGYGGMLANKGGGTLVVSGTSNKFRDSPSSSETSKNPSNSVQVFSGSGHLLGKKVNQPSSISNTVGSAGHGSLSKKTPLFSKSDSDALTKKVGGSRVLGEPSKRLSPNSLEHSPVKMKIQEVASTATKSLSVSCPVCNQEVLETVINAHLDECIVNDSKPIIIPDSNDVIVLSDSDDPTDEGDSGETASLVDCPGCSKKVLEYKLHSHLSSCLSQSFDDDDDDVLVVPDSVTKAKCPICGESISTSDMERHIDNCASCSIQDLSEVFEEDMSDEEEDAAVGSPSKRVSESGERVYPCPCCLILIETSKMNEHLDQCMI